MIKVTLAVLDVLWHYRHFNRGSWPRRRRSQARPNGRVSGQVSGGDDVETAWTIDGPGDQARDPARHPQRWRRAVPADRPRRIAELGFRYRLGGRRRHLGLGGFPTVSLAEARERAVTARGMLRAGQDPVAVKAGQRVTTMLATAKAMTFAQAAAAYIEAHTAAWRPATATQWKKTLASHVLPVIGTLPVQAIDTAAVMRVLTPLWATKTETASSIRNRIETILDWAKVGGHRDGENPARWDGHIEQLLPAKARGSLRCSIMRL